jgi:hypothetical protein
MPRVEKMLRAVEEYNRAREMPDVPKRLTHDLCDNDLLLFSPGSRFARPRGRSTGSRESRRLEGGDGTVWRLPITNAPKCLVQRVMWKREYVTVNFVIRALQPISSFYVRAARQRHTTMSWLTPPISARGEMRVGLVPFRWMPIGVNPIFFHLDLNLKY